MRLGGLYDYAFGLNGNNDALAAPNDTLSFLKDFQNTDRMKIMLSHRPDSFIFGDASKVWDVDLVISGHNHGGQVVIPFFGGLYGGDQGWFPEYIHGMYQKDNILLFETSGLGSDKQKLPRFNNPPSGDSCTYYKVDICYLYKLAYGSRPCASLSDVVKCNYIWKGGVLYDLDTSAGRCG